MYCKQCGKELRDSSAFCEYCGTRAGFGKKQEPVNTMSIVGMIVAGISVFLNFWGLVGIAAVLLSAMGLIQINKSGEKGKGIAITGIALGTFSIIYGFLMIMLFM
ncbi:MAG: DUF4190 domain-containing protein [Oscillospiraceae bacterium]|nr:DUF4190 domain-containing protein [Oscillospiraceae bacterium]MBQ4545376.1 DUF4190 domain-containing protein [Oscillospiraceae bacterium]